ncbi:putative P-loop containing nucleoside triphosphate hydrolase, protein SMG9 [Helianthus annuus]|nr:putative P-loop containing nucleoside triphosphate hydrolase, protein SMG9 [Helianthus annuus]
MAGSGGAPKILLAKPALVSGAKYNRGGDESSRSRLPSVAFLNLLSDSWDFHTDRFLPFLTDNTDFTVVGVIGPPGVGKSTIMNQIYGFDATSPGGMLPPFATESVETQSLAKHSTLGIEPRITSERIILVDTQPVFSPSVFADIIRSDGSSTISVLAAESLPAELAHELMSIQLGVLLTSICHIVLVVSEGVHDTSMWRLMATVDLLKHSLPDPSSLSLSHPQSSNLGSDKEIKDKIQEVGEEYMASPVFVHTKLHEHNSAPSYHEQVKKALNQYFSSTSFNKHKSDGGPLELFFIPQKSNFGTQYESYYSSMWKLRDQVLSMSGPSFSRTVSERDWLKNSGKIWELVKNSSTISDYCRTLQNSGLFRR